MVFFEGGPDLKGQFVDVKIDEARQFSLTGSIVN